MNCSPTYDGAPLARTPRKRRSRVGDIGGASVGQQSLGMQHGSLARCALGNGAAGGAPQDAPRLSSERASVRASQMNWACSSDARPRNTDATRRLCPWPSPYEPTGATKAAVRLAPTPLRLSCAPRAPRSRGPQRAVAMQSRLPGVREELSTRRDMIRSVGRGRILLLDEAYSTLADEYGEFTVTVPLRMAMEPREVWLLGLPDESSPERAITHAAVAERGRKVASFDRHVRVFSLIKVRPLFVEELRSAVSRKHRAHVGGRTPSSAWAATLLSLERLRPEIADDLRFLRRLAGEATLRSVTGGLRLEKDAVGVALEMSGMDRKRYLRDWSPPARSDGFLNGLSSVRLREDQAIQHDAGVFGKWRTIARHVTGETVFESRRGERLTVINTNRTPMERVLGVDLVYYSYRFGSFVIVQYKMFREEGGRWVYRPDEQFYEELHRMSALPSSEWDGLSANYRFSSDPRYLKLCWPRADDPNSTDLVKGRYVPIDFWEGAEAAGQFKGPRGATSVDDANLDRYLNNTEFTSLVAAGWIGSRDAPSRLIQDVIFGALDANRSVMLAIHRPE